MYPHRIRLRGPWTCEPLSRWHDGHTSTSDLPPAFRMTMPGRWADAAVKPAIRIRGQWAAIEWTLRHSCSWTLVPSSNSSGDFESVPAAILLAGMPRSSIKGFGIRYDERKAVAVVRAIVHLPRETAVPLRLQLRIEDESGRSVRLGRAVSVRLR